MSVYTNLSTNDVSLLLTKYNIGLLKSFKGVSDGITNTNYFLNTLLEWLRIPNCSLLI